MLLRGGRASEPVDLRILGGLVVECNAGLASWERSQSLSVTSRLVARNREALKRMAELTGQPMTVIAEQAIEHEVTMLAADLELRLTDALDVVLSYAAERDLGGYLDAVASGEGSDLVPACTAPRHTLTRLGGRHPRARPRWACSPPSHGTDAGSHLG